MASFNFLAASGFCVIFLLQLSISASMPAWKESGSSRLPGTTRIRRQVNGYGVSITSASSQADGSVPASGFMTAYGLNTYGNSAASSRAGGSGTVINVPFTGYGFPTNAFSHAMSSASASNYGNYGPTNGNAFAASKAAASAGAGGQNFYPGHPYYSGGMRPYQYDMFGPGNYGGGGGSAYGGSNYGPGPGMGYGGFGQGGPPQNGFNSGPGPINPNNREGPPGGGGPGPINPNANANAAANAAGSAEVSPGVESLPVQPPIVAPMAAADAAANANAATQQEIPPVADLGPPGVPASASAAAKANADVSAPPEPPISYPAESQSIADAGSQTPPLVDGRVAADTVANVGANTNSGGNVGPGPGPGPGPIQGPVNPQAAGVAQAEGSAAATGSEIGIPVVPVPPSKAQSNAQAAASGSDGVSNANAIADSSAFDDYL